MSALISASALRIAIEYVPPSILKLSKTRLRKHSAQLHERLPASLQQFGFVLPILVDAEMNVVGGEALLEAAMRIGLSEVPIVRIEHLSVIKVRALCSAGEPR